MDIISFFQTINPYLNAGIILFFIDIALVKLRVTKTDIKKSWLLSLGKGLIPIALSSLLYVIIQSFINNVGWPPWFVTITLLFLYYVYAKNIWRS